MTGSARRRAIGIAIAAFWLLMTGWLLRRELGAPSSPPPVAAADATAGPTDTWMAISLAGESGDDDQRVGFLHVAERPEGRHGVQGRTSRLAAELEMTLLGRATSFELSGEIWRAVAARRAELELEVRSGEHELLVEGVLDGGVLEAKVHSAGEVMPFSVPVTDDLLLADGLGSVVDVPLLEPGESMVLDTFDPLTLSTGKARIVCLGIEPRPVAGGEELVRIYSVELSGMESELWIDDDGQVVRAETPVGLVLEEMAQSEVMEALTGSGGHGDGEIGRLLRRTAVIPAGERPFRGAETMVVRATGGELATDWRQRPRDDGAVEIGQAGAAVADARAGEPPAAAELEALLAADPFVQADHPGIVRRAEEIVGAGDGDEPWQRAVAIHDWVFDNLEKEAVLSVPSALEVLRVKKGDCNEHTVLFAALARSAGVPTRVAIGLVWSEAGEGFFYHAWPEVWVGRWVAMDPTLGQPVADATHVKLLEGGIEHWPRLVPFLGSLELDVLEVE